MGFRLQRRVSLGKGSFMNLSGSGLSFTQRTKWGSYGTRGFSIRSGIPGFYYRKRYKKGDMTGVVVLLASLVIGVLIEVALFVIFVFVKVVLVCLAFLLTVLWEVSKWCVLTLWDFSKYCFEQWREHRRQHSQSPVIADSTLAVEVHEEPPNALEPTPTAPSVSSEP
jgi:hypothetical protein